MFLKEDPAFLLKFLELFQVVEKVVMYNGTDLLIFG
jgi:hypothetical protein